MLVSVFFHGFNQVLSASGIKDFDPKVVNMLMEFSSRYIYEVLKEANVYRMHASRDELDVSDIRLAVQCRTDVCVRPFANCSSFDQWLQELDATASEGGILGNLPIEKHVTIAPHSSER